MHATWSFPLVGLITLTAYGVAAASPQAADNAFPAAPAEQAADALPGDRAPALPITITPTGFLVLPAVGQYGRMPLDRDPIEAEIVRGTWKAPADGGQVKAADGEAKAWRPAQLDASGAVDANSLRGGYAWATFDSPAERVMLLEAQGHAMVYVNGQPHAGDPYGLGWLRLPVLVRQGTNTLLFHLAGEKLSVRLTAPPGDVVLMEEDRTLPTLVRGETDSVWGAVPVVNATRDWLDGLTAQCKPADGQAATTPVAPIPPLSVQKIALQIPAVADADGDAVRYHVRLLAPAASRANGGAAPGDSQHEISDEARRKLDESLKDLPPEVAERVRRALDEPPQPPADQTHAEPRVLAETDVELQRVGPDDVQVRTFVSRIDGSVQPYAVRVAGPKDGDEAKQPPDAAGTSPTTRPQPPAPGGSPTARPQRPAAAGDGGNLPGMIVALHDAGVSCREMASQYAPKSWAHVVAPTGRREYGFDWEDWGRIDMLEALADARRHYPSDPRRTYLTGYSMGGHGAWHLGVTYPDRFAAIGPSAAWISFWSYGGGMPSFQVPDPIEALLLRGYATSDTLKLLPNLAQTGVYLLHGSADETVPVAQSRFMRSRLAAFHPNFVYFEQQGAGHWWGRACCDWPPMMDFFRRQALPAPGDRELVDFTTANPGVSGRCDWVSIDQQEEPLNPSRVVMRQNARARLFVGTTANVLRLSIDVRHLSPDEPIDVTLDGQDFSWLAWPDETKRLWFERRDDRWAAVEPPSSALKSPRRNGTWKAALDHDVTLVYGTGGTPEENRWAEAKARCDAETFWYRGGGSLQVLPDTRFDSNRDPDRSVILYGNAATNSAWPMLLSSSPVQVRPGEVRAGTRSETGDDLAVLMVRPRPGSDVALVGVVAGTGPAGMRLTDRTRYFVSGIPYPDLMIFAPDVLERGMPGLHAWGYFGPDWAIDTGTLAWREAAP
jgi:predicted esterase